MLLAVSGWTRKHLLRLIGTIFRRGVCSRSGQVSIYVTLIMQATRKYWFHWHVCLLLQYLCPIKYMLLVVGIFGRRGKRKMHYKYIKMKNLFRFTTYKHIPFPFCWYSSIDQRLTSGLHMSALSLCETNIPWKPVLIMEMWMSASGIGF